MMPRESRDGENMSRTGHCLFPRSFVADVALSALV